MDDRTVTAGNSIEKLLALHCAPALAGVKPSNLFTLHFSEGSRSGWNCAKRRKGCTHAA